MGNQYKNCERGKNRMQRNKFTGSVTKTKLCVAGHIISKRKRCKDCPDFLHRGKVQRIKNTKEIVTKLRHVGCKAEAAAKVLKKVAEDTGRLKKVINAGKQIKA